MPVAHQVGHGFIGGIFDEFVIRLVDEDDGAARDLLAKLLHLGGRPDGARRVVGVAEEDELDALRSAPLHLVEIEIKIVVERDAVDVRADGGGIAFHGFKGGIGREDLAAG